MKKGRSGESRDFFIRSEKSGRGQSVKVDEYDEGSINYSVSSDKSTPPSGARKPRRTAFTASSTIDKRRGNRDLESDDEENSRSDERHSARRRPKDIKKSTSQGRRSLQSRDSGGRSSTSGHRRRRSISTENDSEDDLGSIGNMTRDQDDNDETESSATIQQASPIRKKTSADLLAEESHLLLSQGIGDG